MKVYEVDKKEFYKGYTLDKLLFFKKRLKLVEKELDAGNLEQALVLVMDHPYIDYPEFNFYRINILIRLGKLDLALDVASDLKFKDFIPIQIQKTGLEESLRIRDEQEKQSQVEALEQENMVDNISVKKALMTKLYVGILTLEEIESAELPQFEKILFKICYYDKYNHSVGLKYIKSVKDKFTTDSKRKIFNNLKSRLENKRGFFDISFYKKYLSGVNFDYVDELKKQIEEEEKLKLEAVKETEVREQEKEFVHYEEPGLEKTEKVEEQVPVQLVSEPQVKEPIEDKLYESTEIKVKKVKKLKKDKKSIVDGVDTSIVRIRDAFPVEVQAIGAYIYVEANRQKTAASMKALDIFDSIVNQDVNNINTLTKFENLVMKFSHDERMGISYNEERFNKYLKKELE